MRMYIIGYQSKPMPDIFPVLSPRQVHAYIASHALTHCEISYNLLIKSLSIFAAIFCNSHRE